MGSVCSLQKERNERKAKLQRWANYHIDWPPAVIFGGACTPAIGSLPSRLPLFSGAYWLSFCRLCLFLAAEILTLRKQRSFVRTCKLGYYQTQTIHHPVMLQFVFWRHLRFSDKSDLCEWELWCRLLQMMGVADGVMYSAEQLFHVYS